MAGDIETEEAEDGDRDREDGQTKKRKEEAEEEEEEQIGARERMTLEAHVQGMKAPEEMEAGTGS